MNYHMLWLWSWFIVGQVINIFKRAYFKVTGPDNAVAGYQVYFLTYWPALLFRGAMGGCFYWFTFYPQTMGTIAGWFGWHAAISNLPQIAPVALLAGVGSDAGLDWIATKIPILKGQLPSFVDGVKTTKTTTKETSVTTTTPLIDSAPSSSTEKTTTTKEKI